MLNVRNLYDVRIEHSIQKSINFTVEPGELFAIKGKNGTGKTTLLRLISGIITPPNDTQIEINSTHQYLGAQNGLLLNVEVRHYLSEPTSIFQKNKFQKKVKNLSTGMQRQLALLILTLKKKNLWIIDEPTAHLDTTAQNYFYDTLQKHAKTGGSALIATHDETPNYIRTINIGR